MNCNVKSRNSKQQIHRKHWILKNKDNKHVNGGSSECTIILSVMYHRNVIGRFSSDLQALLIAYFIRRVSFVNNGWRELKETPWSNRKIPCQEIMFSIKSRNSKEQIHSKHFLLKNKDNKHVNGKKNEKMSCRNTKSGSSECRVILSVINGIKLSSRSSEICALPIAGVFPFVSVVVHQNVE
ncbi:hypothetical protein T07_2704 [Trichinella nelsoni]|uniref:Uncharacterized protein n=1 Tax=Trichinella nelsoni TaxID=6336 RepID=A0A0V0SDN2_9BILA|nr:hypothetical protein T07_2704 [Trichinella nelsoni]